MGDFKELTTLPDDMNTFYRISSSGLRFEIKTEVNAAIGLARTPGKICDVWVEIAPDRAWIHSPHVRNDPETCMIPEILNGAEYKPFWLTWINEGIQLGLGHERTPIVNQSNSFDFCYVTFATVVRGDDVKEAAVYWRFELPPVIEKPIPKPKIITGGELHWVKPGRNNKIPDGAFIGGFEKEYLYIIRAPHQGSLTPGKFVPSKGTAFIGWSWDAHVKDEFEFLCGIDGIWVQSSGWDIPNGAIVAGLSENRQREKLYVGRAWHEGHLIPGKVQTSFGVCFISYEGKEIGERKYEILVDPNINDQCTNSQLPETSFQCVFSDTYEDEDDEYGYVYDSSGEIYNDSDSQNDSE